MFTAAFVVESTARSLVPDDHFDRRFLPTHVRVPYCLLGKPTRRLVQVGPSVSVGRRQLQIDGQDTWSSSPFLVANMHAYARVRFEC